MLTARLFFLWLTTGFFGCASNASLSPSSMAVIEKNELYECTELVRGLMLANNDLESAGDIADVRAHATDKMCQARAAAAEKKAASNAWMATWGLPLGSLGGATVAAVVAALLFTFVGR